MNSKQQSKDMEEFSEEVDMNDLASIDDFIKELEAREKDLHISSESVIEIEESDYDEEAVSEVLQAEVSAQAVAAVPTPAPEPAVPEDYIATKVKTSELENEVSRLKEQISKMEAERAELFELSRRRQNDFDNYKKRTERDRSETLNNQLGELATQILPVLDNLGRALGSASDLEGEKTSDFRQFYDGIVLVNQQLNEALGEIGVEPINSVGEKFDPHFHEAVATEEDDELPANTVLGELLRGYQLGEKVIRPAMVTVSTASSSVSENPASES